MPPLRLAISPNPACCKIAVARDDRLVALELLDPRGELAQRNQHRALDMAERSGEFVLFAHVEDLHRPGEFLEPVWIDLPYAGETVAQRRPARVGARVRELSLARFRTTATQIGRHR